MPTDQEKEEYLWRKFVIWANENSVSLEHPDDYEFNWGCWKAAIDAQIEDSI